MASAAMIVLFMMSATNPSRADEGTLHALLVGVNHYGGDYAFNPDFGTVENAVPEMIEALFALQERVGFTDLNIEAYADLMDGRFLSATGGKHYGDDQWWADYGDKVVRWGKPQTSTIKGAVTRLFNKKGEPRNPKAKVIGSNDTLLFYFTGHGEEDENDNNLILNLRHSGDPKVDARRNGEGLETTHLHLNYIITAVQKFLANNAVEKPKRIILILDNCANTDERLNILLNVGDDSYLTRIDELREQNVFVFMGTKPKEYARINQAKSMGYFTERLAQALKGDIDARFRSSFTNLVNTKSLIDFVVEKVKQDTGSKQEPRWYGEPDKDFILGQRLQDMFVYILPNQELTVRQEKLWGTKNVVPNIRSQVRKDWRSKAIDESDAGKFNIGSKLLDSKIQDGANIANFASLLFDCHANIRGGQVCATHEVGRNTYSTNQVIAEIVKKHQFIETRNDERTRLLTILRLVYEETGNKFLALMIDRDSVSSDGKEARWTIKEIKPRSDSSDFFSEAIGVQRELYSAAKGFFPGFDIKTLFVSCFIFPDVTRQMVNEHLDEVAHNDWVEELLIFPGKLKRYLAHRSGLDLHGFGFKGLDRRDLEFNLCDDVFPEHTGVTAHSIIRDHEGTFPLNRDFDEYDDPDIVIGGVVAPLKKSERTYYSALLRINLAAKENDGFKSKKPISSHTIEEYRQHREELMVNLVRELGKNHVKHLLHE